jgi:hypothetical protein
MKKKLQSWLYRKNLDNYLKQTETWNVSFWLISKWLTIIEKGLLFRDLIQRSTQIEALDIRATDYQKREKGTDFLMYTALFNQLRFSCGEVWVIKGVLYRIERIEHLFDIHLCHLDSREVFHINLLFPLAEKDFKYKCNLAINYSTQKFIQWQNESIKRDDEKIKVLMKTLNQDSTAR